MKYETAGDQMSDLKWTRKTTAKIADELASEITVNGIHLFNILKLLT